MNIILFTAIQLINVILSTIKSVITVRGSAINAGIVNACYFTLYYYIIKLITTESLLVVLVVTFSTNLVGVIIGKKIIDLLEKEKLWIYNCSIRITEEKAKQLKQEFEDDGCYCIYEEIKENKFYNFRIFSNTKEKSRVVISKLKDLGARYYVIESKKDE